MAKKPDSFADQIRQCITECGMTRYAIFQATGADQSAMSAFLSGRRDGLSMATLNKVAEAIGMRVVLEPRPAKKARQ
jgi:DNA transposition AAA+ family ATPase